VATLPIQGVRAAVPLDAGPVANIQVRSWQAGASTVTLAAVLAAVEVQAIEEGWTTAISAPPSPRHRMLVAVADGAVVGFAAIAPAGDPDSDPAHEGELVALHVDPSHRVAGHGSRLLAASIDGLRADACSVAYHWINADDLTTRSFLIGAGWAADGGRRELDLHGDRATTVAQLRLHTALDAGSGK